MKSMSFPSLRIGAPLIRALGLTVALAVPFVLASCGGGDGPTDPPAAAVATTLQVTPDSSVLASLGDEATFTAQVLDQRGAAMTSQVVTWRVEPAGIVTLVADGRVRADANGRATLVATVGTTLTKSVVVVVNQRVATVDMQPAAVTLTTLGRTRALVATPKDARGNAIVGRTVTPTFSSASDAIATVGADGVVTARGEGTVLVSASAEGASGSTTVTVRLAVARVAITGDTLTPLRSIGETRLLGFTAFDSAGNAIAGRVATWTSSDAALLTVDATGRVTARAAAGTATVTATVDGVSATARLSLSQTAVAFAAVSGSGQVGEAGSALALPLRVRALDALGVGVAGIVVRWAASAGTPSAASSVTDATGATEVTWTLGTTAGAQSLVATPAASGLPAVTFGATAIAGAAAAATSTVAASPASITANGIATSTITVTLRDAFGNAATRGGATVVIATTLGSVGATTDRGDGTYQATLTSAAQVGTTTVSATVGGAAIASTATVSFVPGPLHHFLVERAGGGPIPRQDAGIVFAVRLTAVDATGNVVTSFAGTADVTASLPLTVGAGATAAFTAGVLASHTVAIGTQGTATVTVTRTGGTESGTSNAFTVEAAPSVTSVTPASGATSIETDVAIVVRFSEPVSAGASAFELTCGAGVLALTATATGAAEVTVRPAALLPLGTTCTLRVIAAQVQDADADDPPDGMAADVTTSFSTAPLIARDETYPFGATGNVSINTAVLATPYSIVDDDNVGPGATITFAGWAGVAGRTERGGNVSVVSSGAGRGRFSYDPAPGADGTDRFTYTIQEGTASSTATVSIQVSGMIWFVDNAAAACTTRASGCGRLSMPYSSLAAFNAENDGVGDRPAAGDGVFLYERAAPYPGPVRLLAGQRLVGQDAAVPLATALGITLAPGSAALPATDASNGTRVIITGATGGIALGASNLVRGLRVATTGGTALSGSGFGTLTVAELRVEATAGAALNLATGALSGSFERVSSNGAVNGVVLSTVSGPLVVTGDGTPASGGIIENASGVGISLTSTDAVSLRWMTLRDNRGGAVRGTTVAGFTIAQSDVLNSGTAATEDALSFTELTGLARIDTVTISNSRRRHVTIANSSGTLDLRSTGSTFATTSAALDADGVAILPAGTARIDAAFDRATFTANRFFHARMIAADAGGGSFALRNSTLSRGVIATPNTQGVVVGGGSDLPGWRGSMTYDISNNDINGSVASAVTAAMGLSTSEASLTGRVRDNRIGESSGRSCSATEYGIRVAAQGNGRHVSAVTNNILQNCQSGSMQALATHGSGSLDLTVTGNRVQLALNGEAFQFQLGDVATNEYGVPDAHSACLVLGDPTNAALKNLLTTGVGGVADFKITQQFSTLLRLPGYTGGATDGAAVRDFLAVRNIRPGDGPATGVATVTNAQGGAACATPP